MLRIRGWYRPPERSIPKVLLRGRKISFWKSFWNRKPRVLPLPPLGGTALASAARCRAAVATACFPSKPVLGSPSTLPAR